MRHRGATWAALLALLLQICVAAVHSHDLPADHTSVAADQQQQQHHDGDADDCPTCAALHAGIGFAPPPTVLPRPVAEPLSRAHRVPDHAPLRRLYHPRAPRAPPVA